MLMPKLSPIKLLQHALKRAAWDSTPHNSFSTLVATLEDFFDRERPEVVGNEDFDPEGNSSNSSE